MKSTLANHNNEQKCADSIYTRDLDICIHLRVPDTQDNAILALVSLIVCAFFYFHLVVFLQAHLNPRQVFLEKKLSARFLLCQEVRYRHEHDQSTTFPTKQ